MPGGSYTDVVHDDLAAHFTELYPELRRMASARLRRAPRDGLLDTTALVHESFEKLARARGILPEDRLRFLAYASRVMRSVVVDLAREQSAGRRGGGAVPITLTTGIGESIGADRSEVVRVHEALEELARIDVRLVQVVEMRYFGGLDNAEVALALGVSMRTVERSWEKARLFLRAELS